VAGTRTRSSAQALTAEGTTAVPRRSWPEMFRLPARELVDLYLRDLHPDAAIDVPARGARDRIAALVDPKPEDRLESILLAVSVVLPEHSRLAA
jgi:hypothetical protein